MTLFSSIPTRTWALIVSSALLQALIFPIAGPVSLTRASAAWFALVPLLVAILLPSRTGNPLRPLQAAILGYVCGVLWYIGNCYWIYQTMYLYGGLPKPVAVGILLLFALYLGLYHAMFVTALNSIQRSRFGTLAALWLAPALWVAVELARARITGFPWDLLGYSQIDNLLLTRLAPVAGVMAVSYVIAAVNAGLASYFFLKKKKRIWIPATAAILGVALQLGSPLGKPAFTPAADQTAIMLQENLEVGAPGKSVRPLSSSEEMQLFSQLSQHPAGSAMLQPNKPPTLLVWPEAPSHFFTSDPNFIASIGRLARTLQAPAIIGSLGVEPAIQNVKGYYLYDSAALFDANGAYRGHYDKIHLVPWGEYIPFKAFFSFAQKLTEGVGDMDPGTERSVFKTGGHTFGTFICYESIFGDEIRHFALNGAQVLVNISDDGWYGDTGAPWQHLNMTRMRAIENRRWLLLDTNTGITTAIDPLGRTLVEAPRHIRGAYSFNFAFMEGLTLYTRFGDWFAWLCTVLSVVFIGLTLFDSKLPRARKA
jgi:apolipoprotein N-acyltransferase